DYCWLPPWGSDWPTRITGGIAARIDCPPASGRRRDGRPTELSARFFAKFPPTVRFRVRIPITFVDTEVTTTVGSEQSGAIMSRCRTTIHRTGIRLFDSATGARALLIPATVFLQGWARSTQAQV